MYISGLGQVRNPCNCGAKCCALLFVIYSAYCGVTFIETACVLVIRIYIKAIDVTLHANSVSVLGVCRHIFLLTNG